MKCIRIKMRILNVSRSHIKIPLHTWLAITCMSFRVVLSMQDYAETTMNELLGWYGYGKAVGSKDTDQLDLKRFASTESNAEERHSNKIPPESHQREKASSPGKCMREV